ncbi:MAG: hypothetical protein NPIRA04_20140 [Nitrospirales bacterium]|nr:MAG: hypothetical protein NPIRA04_20140 [Nitrospirales bacterium]
MSTVRPSSVGIVVNVLVIAGLITSLATISLASGKDESSSSKQGQSEDISKTQHKTPTLLPGHRIITGSVEGISEDQAKVNSGDTGEISPRYLSLERAREKGFTLKDNDKVEIVVNAKNHVVDYHLLNDESESHHKVIKGFLDQPLPVGQEHAMIKLEDGTVKAFQVRPLARSEVAAIPFDTKGLFLIDESNKIASATLTKDIEAERDWARSAKISVYRQVKGVVQENPSEKTLTIKKKDETISLPVWSFVKDDLQELSKGMEVTLLVDRNDKVVDISYPTKKLE